MLLWRRHALSARCVVPGGSRSLRVVVVDRFLFGGGRRCAALAAPLPSALRARSSRRHRRSAALTAAWRMAAAALQWRLALSALCVVPDGSRSLRVVVGAVASSLGAFAVARRSRHRCLRRRAGASGAGSVVPLRTRRRGARPSCFCGGGALSQRGASCPAARALCVRSSARSLPLSGAVAVAQRSRPRSLRRRAGARRPGLAVAPRSRRRGIRPPIFRGSRPPFRRVA